MLIKKYNPKWIEHFADIKREIEHGLAGVEYQIEHVGSTSVPGLDGKDIIDIDIIYSQESQFEQIKVSLTAIGYYHNGNQGIEQREVFKRTGKQANPILDVIKHHLYVCPSDSKALEQHILFRDFLRKNESARLKYQAMKYELAEKAKQDKKRYAELKEQQANDFVNMIIQKAKK